MSRTWRYCHLHSPLPLDPVEWSRSERFKQWLTLGRSLCDVESRFFYEHTNTQQTLAIAHYCPMLVHRFVLFVHVHLAILYAHSYPVTRLLYTKKKREKKFKRRHVSMRHYKLTLVYCCCARCCLSKTNNTHTHALNWWNIEQQHAHGDETIIMALLVVMVLLLYVWSTNSLIQYD